MRGHRWHVDRTFPPPLAPYFPAEFASQKKKGGDTCLFFFYREPKLVFPLFHFNFNEISVTIFDEYSSSSISFRARAREIEARSILMEKWKETCWWQEDIEETFCERNWLEKKFVKVINYRASLIFQIRETIIALFRSVYSLFPSFGLSNIDSGLIAIISCNRTR